MSIMLVYGEGVLPKQLSRGATVKRLKHDPGALRQAVRGENRADRISDKCTVVIFSQDDETVALDAQSIRSDVSILLAEPGEQILTVLGPNWYYPYNSR